MPLHSTAVAFANLRPPPHPPPPTYPRLKYASHPDSIVADSCIVALDMLDFEQSGSFSYAEGDQGAAVPEGGAAVVASA